MGKKKDSEGVCLLSWVTGPCAGKGRLVSDLCAAHGTSHITSTQIECVDFSSFSLLQKCLRLFLFLTLKSSPLSLRNLIKMLPVQFVTHS